jgi:hypothetical protein
MQTAQSDHLTSAAEAAAALLDCWIAGLLDHCCSTGAAAGAGLLAVPCQQQQQLHWPSDQNRVAESMIDEEW